jgi:hypothetical protein
MEEQILHGAFRSEVEDTKPGSPDCGPSKRKPGRRASGRDSAALTPACGLDQASQPSPKGTKKDKGRAMRGMERAIKAAVLATTLLGASGAMAAAGEVTTIVTPVSTNVTYSSAASGGVPPLNTFVGYTVSMVNASGNTINKVSFEGTIFPTDLQEMVTFSSAEGASCSVVAAAPTAPANAVTIQCAFGQFSNGASASFALFFKAPVQDTISPLPAGSDLVTFSGRTITAEGSNGGNSPNNSIDAWTTGAVTLGTNNPTLVKTAVPKSGGSFFTGVGGISLSTDPIATTVTLPTLAAAFTTATIQEGPAAGNCNVFVTCFGTRLTIPGTFTPFLTTVVRLDAANIKSGSKIGSVTIVYTSDDGTVHAVGACASPTTPRADGIPCLASSKYYKNKSVPGWTPALDGDYEFTTISIGNGVIQFF